MSLSTFILCFAAAEIYFRYFYIESDGLGLTLSNQLWGKKYWKPINNGGFRDKNWSKKDLSGKFVIGVVGDSLVAGHGIKNISDRFPDILSAKLGSKHSVINLAQPGWGTKTELLALKEFPIKFDLIILSYFPNDILDTCYSLGRFPPDVITAPSGLLKEIINSSYFLNFVYWNIFRIIRLKDDYFNWIKMQFEDPFVWSTHKEDLEMICSFAHNKKIKLIAVVFPFLTNKVKSDFIINQVKSIFESHEIPVLDVSKLIVNLQEKDLVISKIDSHPSIKLHRLVGESLYDLILTSQKTEIKK